MTTLPGRIRTIDPTEARIDGATVLGRSIHQDPRGLLIETLRADDRTVRGQEFAMSYTSVTVPGQMRDKDRWHAHRLQEDRFVVPLGEMILALYDARPSSATSGRLETIRMAGVPVGSPATSSGTRTVETHLVRIPVGVYHGIANLHPSQPFVLQNYPTRLYDPSDEGRIPFSECPIPSLGGRPFDWALVEVERP
jgi:dTDP-4-dehydrorhamnose 3,5-epimerase-like enzyme